LQRWALEVKEEINFLHFKAGATWILNFKRKHGIVSRKIIKFINYSSKTNQELQIAYQEFVSSVKSFIDLFKIQNIYNTDENGFNLETYYNSGRTLTTQGVKTVETEVQSQSAITHNYIIMPTISASGQLLSPGIERNQWKFWTTCKRDFV